MRNALFASCTALSLMLLAATNAAESLSQWTPRPTDWKGAVVTNDSATLNGDKWSELRASKIFRDVKFSATIAEPTKNFGFFGNGWEKWPASRARSGNGATSPTRGWHRWAVTNGSPSSTAALSTARRIFTD